MRHLGILVVGQSPRPEIEREFHRLVPDARIELVGCLDGLRPEELLAARHGDDLLFTRLPDGSDITLAKSIIVDCGQKQIEALETRGCDAILVLCTGHFPAWTGRHLLFASDLFAGTVRALCPQGRLAILAPLPDQIAHAQERWRTKQHEATALALSPNADPELIEATGDILASLDPDILVLDCVSYTRAIKSRLCARTGKPAVLAVTAAARAAAEWLERE